VAVVSWNLTSGATGYLVYEWNGSSAVQVASVGATTTSASIGGQSPKATEYFYATAYNSTSSASSSWVSIVMPAAATVSAPTNVVAKATSSTTGTISWTASSGATSYSIYYWNGSRSVLLGTVSGSTISVSISGLAAGTTYNFYVAASNGSGAAASGWVSLTMPLSTAVTAHDLLFAQATTQNRPWWPA
jgi:cellulose 1,4-beta-cellobiosidase